MKRFTFIPKRHLPRILGLGLFLQLLDAMILSTAIPQMAISLGASPLQLKLAITTYLMTLAMCVPMSGYLADKYGTKKIFFIALMLFLGGSILCGISFNLEFLILGRMVQGVGASLFSPVGRLVMLKTFSKAEFLQAFATYTLVGQLGMIIGPILGGLIASSLDWRFIFWVNVPVAIFVLYATKKWVPNHAEENLPRFDWRGFWMLGISIATLIFGLSWATDENFNDTIPWMVFCSSFVLFLGYLLYSFKTKRSVLNFKILKIPTFGIPILGGSFFRFFSSGISFLLPLEFQTQYGFTPFQAGLLLLPNAIGFVLARFFFKSLLMALGFRNTLLLAPCVACTAFLGFCRAENYPTPESVAIIVFSMVILGMASSIHYGSMNTIIFADIPPRESSNATSVSTVCQQVGISIGVCFSAGTLLLLAHIFEHDKLSFFVFSDTYSVMGMLSALSAITFFKLKPGVAGHLLQKSD